MSDIARSSFFTAVEAKKDRQGKSIAAQNTEGAYYVAVCPQAFLLLGQQKERLAGKNAVLNRWHDEDTQPQRS